MNKFTKTLVATLSLSVMMVACNKEDKGEAKDKATKATKVADKNTDKATPDDKKPVVAAKAVDATEAVKACWDASNSRDEAAMAKCLDDKTVFTAVDHTPPMSATGSEAIIGMAKMRWAAFSEIKSAPQLVLTNGQKVATIVHVSGTNDGEMMGKPASNKAMSMFATEIVEMSPEGKIVSQRWWMDQGTAMHQMGMHENKDAPSAETAWAETIWAKAEGNETANVEVVKSMAASFEKGDVDGYFAVVADDISFRYVGHKEPAEGKEAYRKGFDMWLAMADHKGTVNEIWGAGDWVVVVSDMTNTMKMDMPGTKDTKGKEVKSSVVEFYQIADGKLKTHWVFENTMNYAVQLGMMDMAAHGDHPAGEHPTGAKGEHPAGAKGDKKAAEHPTGAKGEHPKADKKKADHPKADKKKAGKKKADHPAGEHPKK